MSQVCWLLWPYVSLKQGFSLVVVVLSCLTHVYIYICTYIHMYVYIYVYTKIYVYIYIYSPTIIVLLSRYILCPTILLVVSKNRCPHIITFSRILKPSSYWGTPILGNLHINISGWWFQPLWKIWKWVGMMTFPIYGKSYFFSKPPTRSYFLSTQFIGSAHSLRARAVVGDSVVAPPMETYCGIAGEANMVSLGNEHRN